LLHVCSGDSAKYQGEVPVATLTGPWDWCGAAFACLPKM
jgi:hypothetical protein